MEDSEGWSGSPLSSSSILYPHVPNSLHLHLVPHADPQVLRRRPVAHGDLQEAAAADERQWLPRRYVPVGAPDLADRAAFNADRTDGLGGENLVRKVCRGIAEVINVDDLRARG